MLQKRPWSLYVLLSLLLFQGVSGLGGGIVLMIKPDGSLIHMPVSILHGSVFSNFLIPGVILFLVLGVYPVFTFSIMLAKPKWKFLQQLNIYQDRFVGWSFSLFIGLGLIIWMQVESMVIGYGAFIQAMYSIVGLLILVFTLMPGVMKYFETSNYFAESISRREKANAKLTVSINPQHGHIFI